MPATVTSSSGTAKSSGSVSSLESSLASSNPSVPPSIPSGIVVGCTHPGAANFNPLATEDDGGCQTCYSQGLCVVDDESPCKGPNCNQAGNGCCDSGCLPCEGTGDDCSPSFTMSWTAANGTYYASCYG